MKLRLTLAAALAPMLLSSTSAVAAPPWNQQVMSKIAANFSYPRSAELRKEQGRAVLRLSVAGDGKVTSSELAQSSGSAILDREAIRIASKVGTLPAPPKGTSSITVPIVWRLD